MLCTRICATSGCNCHAPRYLLCCRLINYHFSVLLFQTAAVLLTIVSYPHVTSFRYFFIWSATATSVDRLAPYWQSGIIVCAGGRCAGWSARCRWSARLSALTATWPAVRGTRISCWRRMLPNTMLSLSTTPNLGHRWSMSPMPSGISPSPASRSTNRCV